MNPTRRTWWLGVLLVSPVVCWALVARAQTTSQPATRPAPKLTILKAEYGALPEGESADVTAKVRGMVQNEALTVEATNDTFGDPAEGIVKNLQVAYQFGDGPRQTKSVKEGETLTLRNPGAVDPQGLVLLKAEYGDLPDGRKSDVTGKVQDLVRDGKLTVEVNNENFGDPAEGVVKALRVEYTYRAVKKVAEIEEGQTLTLPPKD